MRAKRHHFISLAAQSANYIIIRSTNEMSMPMKIFQHYKKTSNVKLFYENIFLRL